MTPPILLILCTFLSSTFAAPASSTHLTHSLFRRGNDAIIKGTLPNITALDPITFAPIPQTVPTDGGGPGGFTAPHIIWLGFGAVIGLPLLTVGVRGYRMTTGTGMGLLLAAARESLTSPPPVQFAHFHNLSMGRIRQHHRHR